MHEMIDRLKVPNLKRFDELFITEAIANFERLAVHLFTGDHKEW